MAVSDLAAHNRIGHLSREMDTVKDRLLVLEDGFQAMSRKIADTFTMPAQDPFQELGRRLDEIEGAVTAALSDMSQEIASIRAKQEEHTAAIGPLAAPFKPARGRPRKTPFLP